MDEVELWNQSLDDVRFSRCSGLAKRTANRKSDNKRVNASSVSKKDGPFFCPSCLSEAVVRKCVEKVDHFAHNARHSPIIKRRDQVLHNKCRDEICGYLKIMFPEGKWESERPIPADTKKDLKGLIPDISGRIDNIPIAIEVQASAYTIDRLSTKAAEYNRRGIAVLWIVPLTEDLGKDPFRPRLFEKYLHSLYYGRVYYWMPGNEARLTPVHFSPAKRWIEEANWFDTETSEERTEGGFYLTYRTIKMPNTATNLDIAKDFFKISRNSFEPKNVKKSIPQCLLYKDNLKDWWDKKEYRDTKKQAEVIKKQTVYTIAEDYEYFDEYDDEFYDDEE